ncbi:hypothetical protein ACA910_017790 [Epithemia clementina (nom. ined.)]
MRSFRKHPPIRAMAVASALFMVVYVAVLWHMQAYLTSEEKEHNSRTKTDSRPDSIRIPVPQYKRIIQHNPSDAEEAGKSMESFVARPTRTYIVDKSDIWEQQNHRGGNLPSWMIDYFRWHKETRATLSLTNWDEHRYLILVCHEKSNKCGGTADRLSALPFLLRIAAKSKRLLFVYWGRPCQLEHFLLPPVGGMDWRLPRFLKDTLFANANFGVTEDDLLQLVNSKKSKVVTCRFQSDNHGATYYDKMKRADEKSFAVVTRDTWQVLFTPSPDVSALIVDFLNESHLKPGQYVSAHLRALYAVEDREPAVVRSWTENAVNCSSQLLGPQYFPIFFAADNLAASILAQRYGDHMGVPVVTRRHYKTEPLHLDKATDWRKRKPSEYYDAFVDLYLLSLSRCVAYGVGGFGKFASWLSYNSSCAMQHYATAVGVTPCTLAMVPPYQRYDSGSVVLETASLFYPPMAAQEDTPSTTTTQTSRFEQRILLSEEEKEENGIEIQNLGNMTSMDVWEASQTIPEWMKSYFRWHKEQRQVLNKDNWRNFRFLFMECIKTATHCGGTADRLRSIPFMIRLAAENKRILFLYWEKPNSLESFLLPPRGGLDWRMPAWLVRYLQPKAYGAVNKILPAVKSESNIIVQARLQAHDHGSTYYDTQATLSHDRPAATFRFVYHDCWYSLFTPVPAIAKTIEDELQRLELSPGEFAFAHLRALYGIEKQGRDLGLVKNWTINALNCISSQRPGGPFLFSSDSAYAKRIAVEYGKQKNTPIVARVDAPPPLHLDVVEDWETRNASDFNDIFVDLYLMAMGRCMSYNVGGFAKWAQLISGRGFTCNRRHWTKGVDKKSANKTGCVWVDGSRRVKANKKPNGPLFLPPMAE